MLYAYTKQYGFNNKMFEKINEFFFLYINFYYY